MKIFIIIITLAISEPSYNLGYIGIFLYFVSVDQLTPFPEEIGLLTIGYLASQHIFNPFIAGLISATAFLTIDVAYYLLARAGNKLIIKKTKAKKNSFLTKYKEKLGQNFGSTILILCFIPYLRLYGPILAGIMNLSFKKFMIFETTGMVIFTTIYLSLGMIFHAGLNSLLADLEPYQHFIFIISMILFATPLIIFIRNKQQK